MRFALHLAVAVYILNNEHVSKRPVIARPVALKPCARSQAYVGSAPDWASVGTSESLYLLGFSSESVIPPLSCSTAFRCLLGTLEEMVHRRTFLAGNRAEP